VYLDFEEDQQERLASVATLLFLRRIPRKRKLAKFRENWPRSFDIVIKPRV